MTRLALILLLLLGSGCRDKKPETPARVVWVKAEDFRVGPTVEWAGDEARRQASNYAADLKRAKEFNRTNTEPNTVGGVGSVPWVYNRFTQGSRELGYTSDGFVVWRVPPELQSTNKP